MIDEAYVSFEIAELLKKKDFDETCDTSYLTHSKELYYFEYASCNSENNDEWITAPTLQRAMRWLREIHKLYIVICPIWGEGDMRNPCKWEWSIKDLESITRDYFPTLNFGTDTYEQACQCALRYCLGELINKED